MNAREELIEYKGFEKEIRDTMESEYAMAMYNGDVSTAYEMIGKMMAYKLIEKDDPRIDDTNRAYIKAGIDKRHRFTMDYRKDYGYIPSWLYGSLGSVKTSSVTTIEHWGKRVEGNYEGDTMFPSRNMTYRITLCNSARAVENAFDGIEKLMKENKVKFSRTDLEELCKAGVYKVYEINIDCSCILKFKNIGYTIIRMGESNIEGTMMLNYSSMVGNWMPIRTTISELKKNFESLAKDSTYKLGISPENSIERQVALVNISNDMTIKAEKRALQQVEK